MRGLRPWFLALLLCAPLAALSFAGETAAPAAPAAPAASQVAVTGRFETVGDQRVLTLWGTPRERGFAQGYLLAESILAGIAHDFERTLKPFLPAYENVVKKVVVPRFAFDERETAELEGLFEGIKAHVPAEKLVVAALGRAVDLVDLKALNTFGDWYGLGCSSLAIWGRLTTDGETLVGRNFDFPGFDLVLKHQYVVVRAGDGEARGHVGVSYPGCIGTLTGMNVAGVFVAVHDVRVKPTLDKAMRPNVPRLLAVRRLLEQTQGAQACLQARDLVRTWPTLYGNNLMVVAPERAAGVPRAAVLEYDCRDDLDGGCTLRVDDRGTSLPALEGELDPFACLACTNHHRCREEPPSTLDDKPRWRYPVLQSVDGEARPTEPLDVAGLFAWMTKAAFPRDGQPQRGAEALRGEDRGHGTLHQCVAEPVKRRLHVRLGALGRHIAEATTVAYDVATRVGGAK